VTNVSESTETIIAVISGTLFLGLFLLKWFFRVRAGLAGYRQFSSDHNGGKLHEFVSFDPASGSFSEVRSTSRNELKAAGYKPAVQILRLSKPSGIPNDTEARQWVHIATRHVRWICPW
jgi:hypothetical protein